MAGETQDDSWPLPKLHFSVRFGSQDKDVSFQEVSGIETETQPIEYRHGDNKQFSAIKSPGMVKTGNITLKRGVFVNDNNFWKWHDSIKMNIIQRETITITLRDEAGSAVMSWALAHAWPTQILAVNSETDTTEIAVETLELNHEGLTIKNGS